MSLASVTKEDPVCIGVGWVELGWGGGSGRSKQKETKTLNTQGCRNFVTIPTRFFLVWVLSIILGEGIDYMHMKISLLIVMTISN